MTTPRQVTYRPSWKYWAKDFYLAIALIPLFGVGLIWLIFLLRRLGSDVYYVRNNAIAIHADGNKIEINLADMTDVQLIEPRTYSGQTYAHVQIQTKNGQYLLSALIDAENLVRGLTQILEQIRRNEALNAERNRFTVQADPGSLERINDLVGLWQQGLITDHDYYRELESYKSKSAE
jgi:hypothetical protein